MLEGTNLRGGMTAATPETKRRKIADSIAEKERR
jgi:hypothetical protein